MEQTSKTPWGTTEGLYDPSFEHDNCGIGAIVNIKGTKTHQTVRGHRGQVRWPNICPWWLKERWEINE